MLGFFVFAVDVAILQISSWQWKLFPLLLFYFVFSSTLNVSQQYIFPKLPFNKFFIIIGHFSDNKLLKVEKFHQNNLSQVSSWHAVSSLKWQSIADLVSKMIGLALDLLFCHSIIAHKYWAFSNNVRKTCVLQISSWHWKLLPLLLFCIVISSTLNASQQYL